MNKVVKRWEFWVSVAITLLGIFIFSFAIYYTVTEKDSLGNYVETSGVVVGYEERKSLTNEGRTRYTYSEVVEYVVGGDTYRTANNVSSTSPKELGTTMKIAFNPDNPSDCIFVGSQKFMYVFLFVFGGAITVFGLIFGSHIFKIYNGRPEV